MVKPIWENESYRQGWSWVDNINLESAGKNGITVVNAPRASTQSVVELTMAIFFPVLDTCLNRTEVWAIKMGKNR